MSAEMEAQLARMMAEVTGEVGLPDPDDDAEFMRRSVADLNKFSKKKSAQPPVKAGPRWEESTAVPESPWVTPKDWGQVVSEFTVPDLPSHLVGIMVVEEAKRAVQVAKTTPVDPQELKKSEKRKQKEDETLQAKLDRFSLDALPLDHKEPRTKYVEACNRNKELNLIFQAEKTAVGQLQKTLADRRGEAAALRATLDCDPQYARQISDLDTKKKTLQQKIEVLQTKIGVLEGQICKYQSVFQREFEAEGNLDELLKQQAGWRQRAQKLEIAKARLEELTRDDQSIRARTEKSGPSNLRSLVNSEGRDAEVRQLKESIDEAVG